VPVSRIAKALNCCCGALAGCFQRIRMVWVDGGYSGSPVDFGTLLGLTVQVVNKLAGQISLLTFLPRLRWPAIA
jgi:hypothetical protein